MYIRKCTLYWDRKFWRECRIIAASSELGNWERWGVCRKGVVSSVRGGGERNLRIVEMYKNIRVSGRGAPAQQVTKREWEVAFGKLLTDNRPTELRNVCTLACRIKCQTGNRSEENTTEVGTRTGTVSFFIFIHGSVHRESNLITVQQDATYSVYYNSVGSSTCFGCWHPSSGNWFVCVRSIGY